MSRLYELDCSRNNSLFSEYHETIIRRIGVILLKNNIYTAFISKNLENLFLSYNGKLFSTYKNHIHSHIGKLFNKIDLYNYPIKEDNIIMFDFSTRISRKNKINYLLGNKYNDKIIDGIRLINLKL